MDQMPALTNADPRHWVHDRRLDNAIIDVQFFQGRGVFDGMDKWGDNISAFWFSCFMCLVSGSWSVYDSGVSFWHLL